MMLSSRNIVCLIWLVIVATSRFDYNKTVLIDPEAFDAQFSQDQRYLAIISPLKVSIVNSTTGAVVNTLFLDSYGTNIAVGQKNDKTSKQLLAVGEKSGRITIYDMMTKKQEAKPTEDTQSLITSMSFNSQSSIMVVAYQNNTVRAYDWTNAHAFDLIQPIGGQSEADLKVACSLQNPLQFVVSWAVSNSTDGSSFSVFQIDREEQKIELVTQFNSQDIEEVMDIKPTINGDYLLVGRGPNIYSLNVTAEQLSIFEPTETAGPYSKISFDRKIQNLAILNQTHVTLFVEEQKLIPQKSLFFASLEYVPQYFQSNSSLLAMNSQGGQIFFNSGSNFAQLTEQCDIGTFYQDGQCLGCSQDQCLRCLDSQNCGQCKDRFFLDGQKNCSSCVQRCQRCTNAQACNLCDDPFVITSYGCGCATGFYVDGLICSTCPSQCQDCTAKDKCTSCKNSYSLSKGKCGQGPSIGVFFGFVGAVGAIMLVIIGINAYKVVKSKTGRSLLEDEGGD